MKKVGIMISVPETLEEIKGEHSEAKSFLYYLAKQFSEAPSEEELLDGLDKLVTHLITIGVTAALDKVKEKVEEYNEEDDNSSGDHWIN